MLSELSDENEEKQRLLSCILSLKEEVQNIVKEEDDLFKSIL